MTHSTAARRLATTIMLLTASLIAAAAASAVEVRIPKIVPDPVHRYPVLQPYNSLLNRAYAPCLAPNDVSSDGIPACRPAVTSSCAFAGGELTISSRSSGTPYFEISLEGKPSGAVCNSDAYFVDITVRVTADPYDRVTSCTNGSCTFQDMIVRRHIDRDRVRSSGFLDDPRLADIRDGNFEILGATVYAPDGLPLAATGLGNNDARHLRSGLSLPYAPCTDPDPDGTGDSCAAVLPARACDFESGSITWRLDDQTNLPVLSAELDGLTGVSPLCATGPYSAETTVRVTKVGCLGGGNAFLCTLVDTPITVPLAVTRGRAIDDTVVVTAGGLDPEMFAAQILGMRVLDPTGAPIAAAAAVGTGVLTKTKVSVKGGKLHLKSAYPGVGPDGAFIDPTAGPVTVTLSSRGTVFYRVDIPGPLWQLGAPLGTRWDYEDPAGMFGGVRKARIKGVKLEDPFKLDLVATGVDLTGVDLPSVTISIGIPRDPDLSDGGTIRWAQQTHTCRLKGGPSLSCN